MNQYCAKALKFLMLLLTVVCGPISCGTNTATTGSSGTELSTAETSAFDSGPADILPTIAKLESIDTDFVDVDYVSMAGGGSNLTAYLSSSYIAANDTDCDYNHYQVTLYLGATSLPYAYAYNLETGDDVIAEVSSSTDTVFCLRASEGDYFTLSAMDETQENVGSPLIIVQENGIITITPTNTSALDSGLIPTLANNSLYFVMKDPETASADLIALSAYETVKTYSLYRKNLDGGFLETISEGFTDSPYQLNFADLDGLKMVFMDVSGRLRRLDGEENADGTVSWGKLETVEEDAISTTIDDGDGHRYIKAFSLSNGDVFLANNYYKDAVVTNDSSFVLKHYTVGTLGTVLVDTTGLEEIDFVKVAFSDTLYAIVRESGNLNAVVYEMDLSEGPQTWTNKTKLYEYLSETPDNSIFLASNSGELIFMNDDGYKYVDIVAQSVTGIMDLGGVAIKGINFSLSQIATFSPSGKYLAAILSAASIDGGSYHLLFIHRVGVDAVNTGYLLPKTRLETDTEAMLNFDENDRLVFYNSDLSGDKPQLTVIDLNDIDFDNLTPLELETE